MKVLFDTNVVLDVLLAREPHAIPAARLFALADEGVLDGYVCATTVTTIDYLARKAAGQRAAEGLVRSLLTFFRVAAVDEAVIRGAIDAGMPDFEDAVAVEAARAVGAEGIVSRDAKGFRGLSLPVWLPEELLAMIDTLADHIEVVPLP